ncbi:hypothetical protein [Alicyclobacillus mengziensis]|uniref:Uncharacterized protein n=1 Tax=Alicyclobacillus mengziensis TaxID=2931921 RepID=A0A9X7Z658_9BACL|nr:hypothetical protein [Alicyclobacillus mengziensis]QSO47629.1 hypothetical protein JZ786_00770 [Alicyclobacillus mengziensis]
MTYTKAGSNLRLVLLFLQAKQGFAADDAGFCSSDATTLQRSKTAADEANFKREFIKIDTTDLPE